MRQYLIKVQSGAWIAWLLLALLLYFRLFEFFVLFHFHEVPELTNKEFAGIIKDLLLFSPLLFGLLNLYLIGSKLLDLWNLIIAVWITIFNVFILQYFFYGLRPLDTFIFNYPKIEIFSAISSSNLPPIFVLLQLIIPVALMFYFYKIRKKLNSLLQIKWILGLCFILTCCFFIYREKLFKHPVSMNKSAFFYKNAFHYLINGSNDLNRMIHIGNQFQTLFPRQNYISKAYPLLHKMDTVNEMGLHFFKSGKPPSICLLIIEGLGDKFISEYRGIHLMPFLDSLKHQSLYWDRFLTLGERSFAAVPSLTGSLPYGERGFMFLDQLPIHHTLMNVLNPNHYLSTYFIGQGAWFHNTDALFKYSNAKCIFDKDSFEAKYSKIIVGQDHFFWGYDDKDLFDQACSIVQRENFNPRLDVYFTGTSHAPFQIKDELYYKDRFYNMIPLNSTFIDHFKKYEKQYLSLLFVDDALRNFIYHYQNLPDYNNTIFIITGDHPMTEIPIENSLWRYHVPLLMYSPLLKNPKTFHEVGSHLDLYETLLSYLSCDYGLKIPENSAALGSKLHFDTSYNDHKTIAFMNDNREIIDLFDNGIFLSSKSQLAKVTSSFDYIPFEDADKMDSMIIKLNCFQLMCRYVCQYDRILPPKDYFDGIGKKINQVIYNHSSELSNNEFVTLSKDVEVTNQSIVLHVEFELTRKMNLSCLLVVQVVNELDSTLYWKGVPVHADQTKQKFDIKVPNQPKEKSPNKLKLYLWNKDKLPCGYSNLDIKLYL